MAIKNFPVNCYELSKVESRWCSKVSHHCASCRSFVRSVTLSTCVARRLALISPIDLCVRVHGELNLVRVRLSFRLKKKGKKSNRVKGFFFSRLRCCVICVCIRPRSSRITTPLPRLGSASGLVCAADGARVLPLPRPRVKIRTYYARGS